jgi:hypothetical protein
MMLDDGSDVGWWYTIISTFLKKTAKIKPRVSLQTLLYYYVNLLSPEFSRMKYFYSSAGNT